MEFMLKEIEKALDCGLYYLALQSVLTLPDICGALQSDDGEAKPDKYKTWYDTYAKESGTIAISGESCYRFRCSLLHQARTTHKDLGYSRILFLVPNERITMHNNIICGALNLDINLFCRNMIVAVRKWEAAVKDDPNFIKNYEQMIKVYPHGLPPYASGIPVIT